MKKSTYWLALVWLRFWARLVLWRARPYIIGVTGSAGKSSAIDAIAPVLRLKFKNLKVAEKANSESGIPADILGLHFGESSSPIVDWVRICLLAPFRAFLYPLSLSPHPFDCYLVEMGIDEPIPPKNMEYLLTILKPDIGVILNALPVHTEQFERSDLAVRQGRTLIESIAAEKGKLVTGNKNLKYAILNADQPEINSLKPKSAGAKTFTFGKSPAADVKILSVIPSLSQTKISLSFKQRSYQILLNDIALPEFYGYTIAAALAVVSALNINLKDASDTISKNFKLPPGRGRIFEGIKNTTIIDSSYNASGETMLGSLKMIQQIEKDKTKIAVLGDMLELGSQAETEHQKVAETAVKIADKIILVGPLMNQYALPLIKQSKVPVNWFPTAGQAVGFLLEGSQPSVNSKKVANLHGGEVILVKGSQNTIFLEIVVESLLSNKEDVKKLCRRGKFWDKKRLKYNYFN